MIQAAPSNSLANAPRDAGQEVPFDLRELIYSRTDERGVIQAAKVDEYLHARKQEGATA